MSIGKVAKVFSALCFMLSNARYLCLVLPPPTSCCVSFTQAISSVSSFFFHIFSCSLHVGLLIILPSQLRFTFCTGKRGATWVNGKMSFQRGLSRSQLQVRQETVACCDEFSRTSSFIKIRDKCQRCFRIDSLLLEIK